MSRFNLKARSLHVATTISVLTVSACALVWANLTLTDFDASSGASYDDVNQVITMGASPSFGIVELTVTRTDSDPLLGRALTIANPQLYVQTYNDPAWNDGQGTVESDMIANHFDENSDPDDDEGVVYLTLRGVPALSEQIEVGGASTPEFEVIEN